MAIRENIDRTQKRATEMEFAEFVTWASGHILFEIGQGNTLQSAVNLICNQASASEVFGSRRASGSPNNFLEALADAYPLWPIDDLVKAFENNKRFDEWHVRKFSELHRHLGRLIKRLRKIPRVEERTKQLKTPRKKKSA